jgi:hypothetical protein
MRTASQVLRLPVLAIGFDRVVIVSRTPVGVLNKTLPTQALQKLSHSVNILRYKGPHPRLRSRIVIVSPTTDFWALLAKHADILGRYSATSTEIACDFQITESKPGREQLFELVARVRKRWHKRGHLWSVRTDNVPRAGCSADPTFYFEQGQSTMNLKCYRRSQKLVGGGFGAECLRVEWTIRRVRGLTQHLGGNQIENLQAADLLGFVRRNLSLEEADHAAIGRLFKIGGRPIVDEYRAKRAAYLVLRRLAYREMDKFPDFAYALDVCQNNPAQVRGYLRELRDRDRAPRRGRPKRGTPRRQNTITDYRIGRCLSPYGLHPGLIIRAQLKSVTTSLLITTACSQ